MVSLTSSPLGAFTGDDGLPAAGGALQLLDLSSNILAPIYNEGGTPIANPVRLDSAGCLSHQVFLDTERSYLIKLFAPEYLGADIDPMTFPDADWRFVRSWTQEGEPQYNMEGSVSVDTISELSALVPTLGAIVRVLGYRTAFDCPVRYYRWSTEATTLAKDFGVRIGSTHTGLGSWFLLPQGADMGSYIWGDTGVVGYDTRSALNRGCAYCSANGKRLVIGRGARTGTSGTVVFNCDVLIKDGVAFSGGSEATILDFRKGWEINNRAEFGAICRFKDSSFFGDVYSGWYNQPIADKPNSYYPNPNLGVNCRLICNSALPLKGDAKFRELHFLSGKFCTGTTGYISVRTITSQDLAASAFRTSGITWTVTDPVNLELLNPSDGDFSKFRGNDLVVSTNIIPAFSGDVDLTRFSRLVKIGSGLISNKSGLIIFPPPTVVGKVFNCEVRAAPDSALNFNNFLSADETGFRRAMRSIALSNVGVGETVSEVDDYNIDLTGLTLLGNWEINVNRDIAPTFNMGTSFRLMNGRVNKSGFVFSFNCDEIKISNYVLRRIRGDRVVDFPTNFLNKSDNWRAV